MLINRKHNININSRNKSFWTKKGNLVKQGDKLTVNSIDLPKNSHEKVTLLCDVCKKVTWKTTYQRSHHVKKHRCRSCISKRVCKIPRVKKAQAAAMKGKKRPEHSKKMSGRGNPMFGKPPQWGRFFYKDLWFRSSWEFKLAKFLDKNEIKWEYEPKTFLLQNSSYTPDFYLPSYDLFLEVKGWFKPKDQLKMKEWKLTYPGIKLSMLFQQDLKKVNIL